ncbi:MAG: hypothetical protein CSYNP_01776 [Syntrophus sp. SKADARSKE-3]|nr:hypothetical protein [Syntrophus sp. SKADARSKE-3]
MTGETYWVVLFQSVSYALMAEKVLKQEDVPFKLIPVPKSISSDCGVCLRFAKVDQDRIAESLACKVDYIEMRPLE